jgi:tetratricopeptide (TPR) repeat protein
MEEAMVRPALIICLLLTVASHARAQSTDAHNEPPAARTGNRGTSGFLLTSTVEAARREFERGLAHYYAFDRVRAGEAFAAAERLDPACAMCAWGVALALGPSPDAPRDPAREEGAHRAAVRAAARAAGASMREQGLIGALATRYAAPGASWSRGALDSAYASAMGEVADRFAGDPDVLVLHADALMQLAPNDYRDDDGALRAGTHPIVLRLEAALDRAPRHAGAHQLALRLGLYAEVVRALSERGARTPDEASLLVFAASMAGASATAIEAARRLGKAAIDDGHAAAAVYTTLVTFGRWNDLLAEPLPSRARPWATAVAYYARGAAFAARGRWAEAGAALDTVDAAGAAFPDGPAGATLRVAAHALRGEIALRRNRASVAVREWRAAAELSGDARVPAVARWYYPFQHSLGKAWLAAGRPEEAERAYRDDLARFPENGWSLFGLAQALEGRGQSAAAAAVRERFARAWRDADVALTASRF